MPYKRIAFDVTPEPQTRCHECPVRALALFKGVADEHLDWTQDYRSNQYQLPAKHDVYQEGEDHELAYTLFSGWAFVYKTLTNGKRQIIRFALPGDFLGFQAKLTAPMSHAVQSLTQVTLCGFPRSALAGMLSERTDLASRMITMNARDMALCQNHLMGAGRKSAKERVAFLFLELFHRVKSLGEILPGSDETSIAFPVSQEDIADAMGLTAVHVNRTLRELKDDGLAIATHRRLEILDEPRMAELAQFDAEAVLGDHPFL